MVITKIGCSYFYRWKWSLRGATRKRISWSPHRRIGFCGKHYWCCKIKRVSLQGPIFIHLTMEEVWSCLQQKFLFHFKVQFSPWFPCLQWPPSSSQSFFQARLTGKHYPYITLTSLCADSSLPLFDLFPSDLREWACGSPGSMKL